MCSIHRTVSHTQLSRGHHAQNSRTLPCMSEGLGWGQESALLLTSYSNISTSMKSWSGLKSSCLTLPFITDKVNVFGITGIDGCRRNTSLLS